MGVAKGLLFATCTGTYEGNEKSKNSRVPTPHFPHHYNLSIYENRALVNNISQVNLVVKFLTFPFLTVRDAVVVLIVACRNRSETTLAAFQTLMQNCPTFTSCPGHPSFKHFLERI